MSDSWLRRWKVWLGILAVVTADLWSKQWALNSLPANEILPLIPGLLDFYLAHNTGIAFGWFSDPSGGIWDYLLLILITLLTALVLWLAIRGKNPKESLSWTLVAGGALGNLWERLSLGGVTDFLHLRLGDWSLFVFNLADVAISLGVVILVLLPVFFRSAPTPSTPSALDEESR